MTESHTNSKKHSSWLHLAKAQTDYQRAQEGVKRAQKGVERAQKRMKRALKVLNKAHSDYATIEFFENQHACYEEVASK